MTELTAVRQLPVPVSTATVLPSTTHRMRRVIVVGVLATSVMIALLAASQLINYGVYHLRLHAFDTDRHSSVFGVASLLAELTAAAVIAWRGVRFERQRRSWLTLGALVAGLVLLRIVIYFNAKAVAAPLALAFVLVCWLTRRDRVVARSVVWVALVLMMASVVLHQVGLDADVLNYSNQSWAYQLTAVAKHGCELAGWMLMATGIIAGVADRLVPGGLALRARA